MIALTELIGKEYKESFRDIQRCNIWSKNTEKNIKGRNGRTPKQVYDSLFPGKRGEVAYAYIIGGNQRDIKWLTNQPDGGIDIDRNIMKKYLGISKTVDVKTSIYKPNYRGMCFDVKLKENPIADLYVSMYLYEDTNTIKVNGIYTKETMRKGEVKIGRYKLPYCFISSRHSL
jgi:hypothetical protein